MSAPQVSVLLPSYNHGPFVEEAVHSALAARGVDLELIVVDDGSTDDSVERLRAIGDPRLRLETQENRGAHAAFNRCLDLARGEILFLLNSDDVYEEGRVERLTQRFRRRPELVAAASWIRIVDGSGEELGVKHAWADLPPWPRPRTARRLPALAEIGDPALALLETNWLSTTSNLACRRATVERLGLRFAPLRYCHDWDFFLALAAAGPVELVEEPLLRYRVHGENTIREGLDLGKGRMRFEILWLLARRAAAVLRGAAARLEISREELEIRFWRGLPRFGCGEIAAQLLFLRGDSLLGDSLAGDSLPGDRDAPSADFLALLEPGHPWRKRAVEALAEAEP